MSGLLIVLAGLVLSAPEAPPVPESVRLVPDFSAKAFTNPDSMFWPAYFWLWNAPLDEETLRAQLRDMAAHDARSVCMLPMPRGFRPESTNNAMEPDYLTPAYLDRVALAVDEAAKLGMNWWLYDEGGWPSGLALGKVIDGPPELARQRIVREAVPASAPFAVPADALALVVEAPSLQVYQPGETWTPPSPDATAYLYHTAPEGTANLLNPDTTRRFMALTHEAYAQVISAHFGKTVRFTFTDEPGAGMPRPPDFLPWTPGLDALWQAQTGSPLWNALPALFSPPGKATSSEVARARIDLYDVLSGRFADAYFGSLENWGRAHGLASGGHLGGEDETLGAVKYSFGHVLRPLRRMDIPGVDLIWRQLFPGRGPQSNFPVLAPTAAHQNGTRFAFSESFCVYGNGLTPAQMKWLVDYQYVRGINLVVLGCFPLSTRDHHMTGERPHFGAMNPLWDHLPGFHAYTARLGYAMSVGAPDIRTALYYPARDIWAWGEEATEAATTFEALEAGLAARQCAFDLVDDDTLSAATLADGTLRVGPMQYDTILCGDVRWMSAASLRQLEAFAAAGGNVLSVDHAPRSDGAGDAPPVSPITSGALEDMLNGVKLSVRLNPSTPNLRACLRTLPGQEMVMLFNEGAEAYAGAMEVAQPFAAALDLQHGGLSACAIRDGRLSVVLGPGESIVYLLSSTPIREALPERQTADSFTIESNALKVTRVRHYVAGEHDFEVVEPPLGDLPPVSGPGWKDWLGEDFSGDVDYTATINIPEAWGAGPLRFETGPIEYAASVTLDEMPAGQLLWTPWSIDLPTCAPGPHTLRIRVANTLANELTSARVEQAWAAKEGPGWPSPYHVRALAFERESRGGGLPGPLRITRLNAAR